MNINFIFEMVLIIIIGTIASYLAIQGTNFLIRYIREKHFNKTNAYLEDWNVFDFDSNIPVPKFNAKEFTDDEVILDAQDWCKEEDRIAFIMVKANNKVNLVTKNYVLDTTDIYNKFYKEENNEQQEESTDRTDADNNVDSADEDR